MKKQLLFLALLMMSSVFYAQDLTSKKGETMLPEEGDYAIGFDADPFLNYVGNFLNSNSNTAPGADFANSDQSIMGKMFKDAQTAYRGRVRIGFGSTTSTMKDTSGYWAGEEVMKTNNIVLGGGIEKRRGNTRVQGFYGGEALISLGGSSDSYTYDNDLSKGDEGITRITEMKNGPSFGFGVRGFAGVEVFVFPKTSIGFEYGWGLGINTTGKTETTTETYTTDGLQTDTSTNDGGSSFGIDTDNGGGRINVLFHF